MKLLHPADRPILLSFLFTRIESVLNGHSSTRRSPSRTDKVLPLACAGLRQPVDVWQLLLLRRAGAAGQAAARSTALFRSEHRPAELVLLDCAHSHGIDRRHPH